MTAVKEPSADHLNLYIGILFALAFIGYFLYSNFISNQPKLFKEQLLLSDMVDTSEKSVSKDAAFHKQLDQAGPFMPGPSGILDKDTMIKLRTIIAEKAYSDFKDRRE